MLKLTVQGEKQLSCEDCGQQLENGSLIINSKCVDEGEKQLSCADYLQKFTQTGHLNHHLITVHKGEK